jgi:hypothetical protein
MFCQGCIYCGAHPLALARGGAEEVLFFMIKAKKNIRSKIRYSNLSNNMMISEL